MGSYFFQRGEDKDTLGYGGMGENEVRAVEDVLAHKEEVKVEAAVLIALGFWQAGPAKMLFHVQEVLQEGLWGQTALYFPHGIDEKMRAVHVQRAAAIGRRKPLQVHGGMLAQKGPGRLQQL